VARIACCDVKAIPRVVESSLGLDIYDFFFEREIQKEVEEQKLNSVVMMEDEDQKSLYES
jgi:hypothetical protein